VARKLWLPITAKVVADLATILALLMFLAFSDAENSSDEWCGSVQRFAAGNRRTIRHTYCGAKTQSASSGKATFEICR
jgi:hypothetical protein